MRWLVPVGRRRWPAAAFGLLAAVFGALLMLGGWVTTGAPAVLVAAGAVLLLLTLVPVAWALAAVAALALLVTSPVVAGLGVFLGGAVVLRKTPLRVAATATGALVLAGALVLQVTHPRPDAFYAAPAHPPAGHGVLLRSEPFTRGVPSSSKARRILYTTTRGDGTATVASAIVVAATQAPATPRPVVVWAHGATGLAPDCAPSLRPGPVGTGSIPDLAPALAAGWIVIAPDYPGLGTKGPHPFLIGPGEARSLLDAVLAVRDLTDLRPAPQTLVWGHSQGGNAALWTGIIAPAYAPAVDLKGVAALAPGSDVPRLADHWRDEIYSAYLIESYSETYPDVRFDAYVRAEDRVTVREQAGRCLDDPKIYLSTLSVLRGGDIWKTPPNSGALGARLRDNVPDQPIAVPVLIGQGKADTTVPATIQDDYVRRECATGTTVDYRTFPGLDHVGVLSGDSPDLVGWSRDRLDGKPPASTCSR
ncbi:alpha/beta fold hydrolase [Actinoplanes sp. NPDC051411]|uniref:alpha/beta fold hydrolase n=1 Tax=Actinoplanes sp. NPDC051411 TaxID=3155522 RepID=UPI003449592E